MTDPKFIFRQAFLDGDWHTVLPHEYVTAKENGKPVRSLAIMPSHTITAREWWGGSGMIYKAELRDADTGNIVKTFEGSGRDQWQYDIRDAMPALFPALYPPHDNGHPTIYFREVANVPYDRREVQRRKDL
jgi:hypothetical protein